MTLQEAAAENDHFREWWSDARQSRFEYIELGDCVLLHFIHVGWSGWVAVIGHPSDGSYEWVAREDGNYDGDTSAAFRHSNQGYGDSVIALRDALVAMTE